MSVVRGSPVELRTFHSPLLQQDLGSETKTSSLFSNLADVPNFSSFFDSSRREIIKPQILVCPCYWLPINRHFLNTRLLGQIML